jgi:membrane protease YdiL (CAAX protease family)
MEPQAGSDVTQAQRPNTETLAETWHTLLLIVFVVAWFYFAKARFFYLRGHLSFNHVAIYLRLMLVEGALVGFIAWGVRRRGGSLRAIIGGCWDSAMKVFADLGVAALFWIAALVCLGLLRGTLVRLGAPPVPQVTRTLPSPREPGSSEGPRTSQEPRSFQVPRAVDYLAPRSNLEIPVWIVLCLIVGFCEEVIFRGYLQRQFVAWTNRPIGIVLSAALFGLGHGYQGRTTQILLGFFGLFLGILAEKRKSLRPGMLAHSWQDLIAGLALTLLRRLSAS